MPCWNIRWDDLQVHDVRQFRIVHESVNSLLCVSNCHFGSDEGGFSLSDGGFDTNQLATNDVNLAASGEVFIDFFRS